MSEVDEHEPLLRPAGSPSLCYAAGSETTLRPSGNGSIQGEDFNDVPRQKRQLGFTSVIFLIFNRIIGTGIYATPSLILRSCGSVGLSLMMWLLGAIIASAGTAVFVELGTGLPRSGGEKNYLEFIYRRPKFLITYVYALFVILMGWSAGATVLFGEYFIHALDRDPTLTNTRLVGALALTLTFLLHATTLDWGLRLQNALGIFTLLVMTFIILTGLAIVIFPRLLSVDQTDNLQWSKLWVGTRIEPNSFVTALCNVVWCYNGYGNANYALSEVRDPVRTIKRAAPLAMLAVILVYILVNIFYFALIPKGEILDGGRVTAALFFRNVFGPQVDRFVSLIIALSLLGNMLALQFSQSRVIQELGREGILPYSSWFASSQPFNTPLGGLSVQWFVSLIAAISPPPGDAFNFVLQLVAYPTVMINAAVSAGLLFLHTRRARKNGFVWLPPFTAWTSAAVFFFLSNVFLVIVPLVPPAPGYSAYKHLPYFLHVIVALMIALIGIICYYLRCVYLPRRGGYKLDRVSIQEDGVPRNVIKKVRLE